MRQFAGFGSADDTNRRFRYLLSQGPDRPFRRLRSAHADGLRLRPPARRGRSRQVRRGHQFARRHGSALRPDSARGRHHFDDHQFARRDHLGDVSGRRRKAGRRLEAQSPGTLQNDILKEYIAQKEYIYPPEPSHAPGDRHDRIRRASTRRSSIRFRSAATTFARPARPRFRNWPSRCATASSTSSGASAAGMHVDDFAPRLSFFFNAHNDFFEEIAKYRAARRIW